MTRKSKDLYNTAVEAWINALFIYFIKHYNDN
jgi:hypothetical protein